MTYSYEVVSWFKCHVDDGGRNCEAGCFSELKECMDGLNAQQQALRSAVFA
jgi:hypothetical protein